MGGATQFVAPLKETSQSLEKKKTRGHLVLYGGGVNQNSLYTSKKRAE